MPDDSSWVNRFIAALIAARREESGEGDQAGAVLDQELMVNTVYSASEGVEATWITQGRAGDRRYVLLAVRETLVVARWGDALELEVVPDWRYVERWKSGGELELELDYGPALAEPLRVTGQLSSRDPSVRQAQAWFRQRAGLSEPFGP